MAEIQITRRTRRRQRQRQRQGSGTIVPAESTALRPLPGARPRLEVAVAGIEKQFGKGAIMRLGEGGASWPWPGIPTGAIALDLALGIGGVPRGRVVEIYGPESSGKTTLALHIIAEAQRQGGVAPIIDAEHALDPEMAQNMCGVKIEDLLVSQPDTGEQALEICEMLVRSGAVDVVVIDSVAALTPRAEIEGDMGDSLPGLQARLMSQALRKLTAPSPRATAASSSSTRSARRSGSCSATRRPPRGAGP